MPGQLMPARSTYSHHALQGTMVELQAAFEACDFPLAVWSLPEGVVLLANNAAAELFDLWLDQLVSRHIADVVADDTYGRATGLLASGVIDDARVDRRIR